MATKKEEFIDKYKPNWDPPYIDRIESVKSSAQYLVKRVQDRELVISPNNFHTLIDEETVHPVAMYVGMYGPYDDDWITWEPETIHKTIKEEYQELSESDKNIIGALKGFINSSKFWKDYRVFGWTCHAWDGRIPTFTRLPLPTPGQMLDTLETHSVIKKGIFTREIKTYVREALSHYGVSNPLSLDLANRLQSDLAKEYLNAKTKKAVEDVVEEANSNRNAFDLKTIGTIDYYLTRLNLMKRQVELITGEAVS